jgi:hypothetical protein
MTDGSHRSQPSSWQSAAGIGPESGSASEPAVNRLRLGQLLGRGGFSEVGSTHGQAECVCIVLYTHPSSHLALQVYEGTWKGIKVAVKCILFPGSGGVNSARQRAITEAALCCSMEHNNGVQRWVHVKLTSCCN